MIGLEGQPWMSLTYRGIPEVPTRWQRVLIRLKLRAPPRAPHPLDGSFVAYDAAGAILAISPDGITWTPCTPERSDP